MEEKVNALVTDKKTPWTTILSALRGWTDLPISDEAYRQFPNYILTINLEERKLGSMTSNRRLYLVVSLITTHFTFFIKEDICVKLDNERSSTNTGFLSAIHAGFAPNEVELTEFLSAEMSKHFPDHIHIHHKILFDCKVSGGVPYGLDLTSTPHKSYTMFEFLFEPFPFCEHFLILD